MSRHYHSLLNVLTSAAFSYAKNSYHQDEADPTPTITGSPGGTFSATPSGLSINASTGTIDLENSTIQAYTITYTVSGVSSNFNLSVTASPFVANNFSMNFDSASSQYVDAGTGLGNFLGDNYSGSLSASLWFKRATSGNQGILSFTSGGWGEFNIICLGNNIRFAINATAYYIIHDSSTGYSFDTDWHHIVAVMTPNSGLLDIKLYFDGQELSITPQGSQPSTDNMDFANNQLLIGAWSTGAFYFDGNMDEVAIWNTALGETAIQEIYNATYNNTGKALDLSTDYNNYTSSSNLQYWNRLGD